MNKKFCNSNHPPPGPRWSPFKKKHASLQTASHSSLRRPHTAHTHIYTHTHSASKQNTTLPFVPGGGRVSPRLARRTRGVSATQTPARTRDRHHDCESLKFVSVFGGIEGKGGKKVRNQQQQKITRFLLFRGLTC